MTTITESQFDDEYQPRIAPSGDLLDYADVVNEPLHHVWTIVEAEDDETGRADWMALPGFHIVNKLGYCITAKPWVTGDETAMYAEGLEPDDEEDQE